MQSRYIAEHTRFRKIAPSSEWDGIEGRIPLPTVKVVRTIWLCRGIRQGSFAVLPDLVVYSRTTACSGKTSLLLKIPPFRRPLRALSRGIKKEKIHVQRCCLHIQRIQLNGVADVTTVPTLPPSYHHLVTVSVCSSKESPTLNTNPGIPSVTLRRSRSYEKYQIFFAICVTGTVCRAMLQLRSGAFLVHGWRVW